MPDTRNLREQHAGLLKEAQALADGDFGPAERARFERTMAGAQEMARQIRLEEVRYGGPPQAGFGDYNTSGETQEQRDHKAAFSAYLRTGINELGEDHRRILDRYRVRLGAEWRDTTATMGTGGVAAWPGSGGTAGGYLVPVGFQHEIEQALKFYGPMLDSNVTRLVPTATGQPLPWPTVQDTSIEGEIVGEGTEVTQDDVTVGMSLLGAYKFSSKLVKVSLELMTDSAFDFQQFLTEMFSIRLGRILNRKFTLGSGTLEPTGLVTAALAGGNTVTAVGSYANDSTGAANTIGSDDLIALEHAVDPLFRLDKSCRYMLADGTLRSIKQLKDKFGRPLWLPAIAGGAPETINGYPFSVNPYLDELQTRSSSPAVTKNTVLFGPMQKYIVRRVKDMAVLRLSERFAEYGVVGFIAFARYDGNLLAATGSTPIAVLQNTY